MELPARAAAAPSIAPRNSRRADPGERDVDVAALDRADDVGGGARPRIIAVERIAADVADDPAAREGVCRWSVAGIVADQLDADPELSQPRVVERQALRACRPRASRTCRSSGNKAASSPPFRHCCRCPARSRISARSACCGHSRGAAPTRLFEPGVEVGGDHLGELVLEALAGAGWRRGGCWGRRMPSACAGGRTSRAAARRTGSAVTVFIWSRDRAPWLATEFTVRATYSVRDRRRSSSPTGR